MMLTVERVTIPLAIVAFVAMLAVAVGSAGPDRTAWVVLLFAAGSAAMSAKNSYGAKEPPFSRSVSKRVLFLSLGIFVLFAGGLLFGA
jgi:hypothetical protein